MWLPPWLLGMGARGCPPALLDRLLDLLRDQPDQEQSIIDLTTQMYGQDTWSHRRRLTQLLLRLGKYQPGLTIHSARRRGITYYRTTWRTLPSPSTSESSGSERNLPRPISLDWLD